ncbi:TetR/AcrR family transcriptional regulator [Gordonia zhaorongruii]|uniref:TetR/AcrR family transcriptional regulator n=1 Tax=Gordonia zhaorongruii TaxID=2597659 RepID=UPI00104F89C8|nr:TetR family transcriptional regulator [Gordonia zhaorongruii]
MARLTVEQRRASVITATLRVVATDGVEAATTRRIASEAGMGQSSIFYAFESRDELLAAVVEQGVADELAVMIDWADRLAGLPACDGPADELIRTALSAFTDSVIADPGRQQALISLALYARRTDGLAHLAERLYEGYYEAAVRVFDQVARITGRTWRVPPADLAPTIIAQTDGITLCWLGTGSRAVVDSVIESAVTLFVGYLD